jgi:hypothetical protein
MDNPLLLPVLVELVLILPKRDNVLEPLMGL